MDAKIAAILLTVVVVALAIAPVYWMRPSPRQRQLARLRAHAIKLGLRAEMCATTQSMQRLGYPPEMIKYQWYRPGGNWPGEGVSWLALSEPAAAGNGAVHWLTTAGYSRGPDKLLESIDAASSPGGLCAVQVDPTGAGVYWHEAGTAELVDQIFALLQPWAEAYREANR